MVLVLFYFVFVTNFVWYIQFCVIYTILCCIVWKIYCGKQMFECYFQFSLKYEMKWSPLKYYDVWYEWCWSFVPVWSSHVADQQMNRRAWSTTKYSFSSKTLDCHKIRQHLFWFIKKIVQLGVLKMEYIQNIINVVFIW